MSDETRHESKGVDLRGLLTWVQETREPAEFDRWLDALAPEVRELYDPATVKMIHDSRWYSTEECLLTPLQAACDLFYGGDVKKGGWAFGLFSGDYAFQGVYRILLRHGPARLMIAQAGRVLGLYIRPGKVVVSESGDDFCVLCFHGTPSSVLYDYQMAGLVERILELTGKRPRDCKLSRSIEWGDPFSEISFSWDEGD